MADLPASLLGNPSPLHGLSDLSFVAIQATILILVIFLLAILIVKARAHLTHSRHEEAGHRILASYGGEIVLRVSLEGKLNYASPAICDALGWAPQDILGRQCAKLVHEEDRLPFEVALQRVGGSPDGLNFIHRLRRQDGEHVWFESRCHLAHEPQTGAESEIIVVSRDISRQRQAEIALETANRRLHMLSRTDALTGIPNKRWFDEQTSTELLRAVRSEAPVSLLMVDIDDLSGYNEHFGYEAGDGCLRSVATAVELSAARPGDFTARYQGDVFAALLPDTDIAGAVLLAEKIRNSVRELAVLDREGAFVSVSVGAACVLPGRHGNREQLTAIAERALQNAKKAGRNAVRVAPVLSDYANLHHRSVTTKLPALQ